MKKTPSFKLFFFVFLISLFLLLLITLTYSYTLSPDTWYIELLYTQFLYIPFLLFLAMVALLLAVLVTMALYSANRHNWKETEEALEMLAEGNYSAEVFSKIYQENMGGMGSSIAIKEDIIKIRNKLAALSKEVQIINSQPRMLDGKTKEEILEKERHRLARELHDSVSQQLFAAMMMLSALNEQAEGSNDVLQKQLETIEGIVNEAQSEMRALLLHLRPVNLEGKTLKIGVEQLLRELSTKIKFDLSWDIEEVYLTKGMEDHVFRIVQELLSNTLRHAKAKEMEVYLKNNGDMVLLRVIDDGIGFDTSSKKAGSYGLQNIQERVSGMGGTCRIISFPKKGTSVEIRIPVIKGGTKE